MKISACLVIHNEEAVLFKCLKSLKQIASEIIIIHDGPCRDKSLQIARDFGAKIYVRNFVGEAEFHRPFSYQKASGDWILQIDADEVLSAKLVKTIPQLANSTSCDAYSFSWPYPDKQGLIKNGPFAKTLKPSLFKKNLLYMIGISHEYPRSYGRMCLRNDLTVIHSPSYDNFTLSMFVSKWNNWAHLQAEQLKYLDRLPLFNIPDKYHSPLFLEIKRTYQYPILTGLSESFKFLLLYFWRGLLFAGFRSWKIALFEITYIWLVRFYSLKKKYG